MTVSVVKSSAWSGQGQFEGVASNYLASLSPNSIIKINTRPSMTSFHLPEDSKRPLIMVCAGSGIAPFRGFIQERAIQKSRGQEVGKALLFFGFDHPDIDFLYKKELLTWEQQGVIALYTAHSAKPDSDISFIQHRLWQEREVVYDFIVAGAKIYVCGDGKYMAPAVRDTFKKIYATYTQASDAVAEKWVTEMQKDGVRYVADVYV